MENVRNQILNLINTHGKSASKITEALCSIGDGKMEVGITRIAKYFENIGIIKGSVGTLSTIALIVVIKKFVYDKFKNNQKDGEEILNGLEEILINDEVAVVNEVNSENLTINKGSSLPVDEIVDNNFQSVL